MRRRFTTTADSDHDQPIFPNRAETVALDGPDKLWVADITYVPIVGSFVYVAVILDAWSRRVVGYAISRSIDARLTLAALSVAIETRKPPPGCVHHSDRGSQYAAKTYRDYLANHGIEGSMGRRGNPYDNAKAESFMKDAQGRGRLSNGVRDICRRCRKSFPIYRRRLQYPKAPLGSRLYQPATVRESTFPADGQSSDLILSARRGPLH
ncbi:transposase InsO family protein [Nitrobacteraceae bacterium AZCC 2146]